MKLVRDRIGDIPWPDEQAKQHLGWVEPHSPKYRELLRDKLAEEVAELVEADRRGNWRDVTTEAADVFEALRALLVANGWRAAVVDRLLANKVAAKRTERGGFFQGRTYDGSVRENHPAGPLSTPVAVEPAPEVVQDAPEAPGSSQRAEAERVWGHPLQYASVGRITIVHSEHMDDHAVRAAAGPAGACGLPIERYDRCPTCEQWSPCDIRKAVAGDS